MLRANRCPGSTRLGEVTGGPDPSANRWGRIVCPGCGLEGEPLHSTVRRLKHTFAPGDKFFRAGMWVGRVRIHYRRDLQGWSRG